MTEQLEAKYNVKSECFQNQKNEFFLVRGQSIYSDFSEFMHITKAKMVTRIHIEIPSGIRPRL